MLPIILQDARDCVSVHSVGTVGGLSATNGYGHAQRGLCDPEVGRLSSNGPRLAFPARPIGDKAVRKSVSIWTLHFAGNVNYLNAATTRRAIPIGCQRSEMSSSQTPPTETIITDLLISVKSR